ncbi:MAG: D-alanyl-D-alanine carboxypeptidase/D-alanyl-D-alanine-endopeptidase [Rhodospirillaceae bacterium]|nr:D-alanyl-D-alanine carboxypeptidase/D-alanyl-D-alanine-endopeptidase [Rhodospirillaceae bacterium]
MRQRNVLWAVLTAGVFVLAAGAAHATGADSQTTGAATAPLGLEELFKRFRIDERSVGYIALDAATGAVLTARRPDGAFVPASAIKAPTAVMALEVLGPAYRAETRLYRSGTVGSGVLKGDLVLVGGGDPELYTEDFLPMIRALKKRGIRRINGRFLFDDSLFPEARAISGVHNVDAAYNPGVGALSLNFNRLRLNWRRSGKSLKAQIFSKTDNMVVPVDIVAAGVAPAGTRARRGVVRTVEGGTPRWMVVPTTKRSGAMWVPVKRPGLVAAHVFQQLAGQHGIAVPDPGRGALPAGAALVAVHRSEPLIEAVRHFLKYSNNVATEIIGLATTRRFAGAPLDLAQSGAAMAAWWRRQIPGANRASLRIANHSGLSLETRISPRQMAAFLRWARDRDYAGQRLWDLMQPYWVGAGKARATRPRLRNGNHAGSRPGGSAAGRSGPVRAAMQIRGKTGTLNHARSLAGYMVTRSKREVVFAVFLDDERARLAAAEAGRRYRQLKPARWAWRSRVVLNNIVRKIMLEF